MMKSAILKANYLQKIRLLNRKVTIPDENKQNKNKKKIMIQDSERRNF